MPESHVPAWTDEDVFDPEPEAPVAPSDEQCCGNGCQPCVWDHYRNELAAYRLRLADWQRRQEGV